MSDVQFDEPEGSFAAFPTFHETRTRRRKKRAVADWRQYFDSLSQIYESRPLLRVGHIRHADILVIAHRRYEQFDARRPLADAQVADVDDMTELDRTEGQLSTKGPRP
jgi:hypothetical protein